MPIWRNYRWNDATESVGESHAIALDEFVRTLFNLNLSLDAFVVMPNQLHGILILHGSRAGFNPNYLSTAS